MFVRVDSILLLEEGFRVFSSDASDKMLKYALKERWIRRKEPEFDAWGEWAGWAERVGGVAVGGWRGRVEWVGGGIRGVNGC